MSSNPVNQPSPHSWLPPQPGPFQPEQASSFSQGSPPSRRPGPRQRRGTLIPFLIAGFIETSYPFIIVMIWPSYRAFGLQAFADIFEGAWGEILKSESVLKPSDPISLLVFFFREVLPILADHLSSFFSFSPVAMKYLYPYYSPALVCTLVAFFTGLLVARRTGQIRPGLLASLLAALVSSLIMLIADLIASWVSLDSILQGVLLPNVLHYLGLLGFASLLLSLLCSWLGGLIGRRW